MADNTKPTVIIDNHAQGAGEDTPAPEERRKAWVRYRTEYRHPINGEVIHKKDTDGLYTESYEDNDSQWPAFEIITTYKVRMTSVTGAGINNTEAIPISTSLSTPSYHMNIYSVAIINALQSVVKYYPLQNLTGDSVVVKWPFPVLVHHYKELIAFRDTCASTNPDILCVKEKGAQEHIDLLMCFLDEHIMPAVHAEEARNARGFETWESLWVKYKPGSTTLAKPVLDKEYNANVVHSLSGGTFMNPPEPWCLTLWSLKFDGTLLNRFKSTVIQDKFDGECASHAKTIAVEDQDFNQDSVASFGEILSRRYELGKRYWQLLEKQCQHYKGKVGDFPYNEIEGTVMSDLESFYKENSGFIPAVMDTDDLRNWTTDCVCTVCKKRKVGSGEAVTSRFDDYNGIPLDCGELTAHQYLLCPFEIKAFVFATRTWQKLHVGHFGPPQFQENLINNLVMDDSRKRSLMALAKSFARVNKCGEEVARDMWAADFVQGKGSGLIFLLHGQPGVGKTCTAECIAAFTKRPLMVLTSSDIGTYPSDVEANLARNFNRAKSWGAVVLIDEADVFMERRTSSDLMRNGLVASFLRALEYYHGILFLTTNRVGSFDDAFISRIHVKLYYQDFTESQRQQVWQTFIDRLAQDRGDYMRLNIDAKEYLRSSHVKAMKWNGREIRNGFQTAVALAEYDGEKDEEGKILLTDAHFKPVIELSEDFKEYLKDLHKGDVAKRAERKYERLDTFSG